MVSDIVAMIRDKSISPFCTLSDRGLEAAFAGSLDVVHLTAGGTFDVAPEGYQYTTVLRGALDVLGATDHHAERHIRSHDTATSPYVFHGDHGAIRLRAHEDTLMLHGSGDVIDDIVSIDTLVSSQALDVDVLQLILMRGSKSFATLPTPALLDVYARMKEIPVQAGQEIVRQDMKGDQFYFIREGAAEVWREELDDDEPRHVATLATGDGFGEEALILDGARNATVKMITPGRLLALDGENYKELVAKPAVARISNAQAKDKLCNGAQLVDVRYADEWEEGYIPGAAHIPLSDLRGRKAELDKSRDVVVYCRSGRRSQVGAILLTQYGFQAASMDGGILEWPDAIAVD